MKVLKAPVIGGSPSHCHYALLVVQPPLLPEHQTGLAADSDHLSWGSYGILFSISVGNSPVVSVWIYCQNLRFRRGHGRDCDVCPGSCSRQLREIRSFWGVNPWWAMPTRGFLHVKEIWFVRKKRVVVDHTFSAKFLWQRYNQCCQWAMLSWGDDVTFPSDQWFVCMCGSGCWSSKGHQRNTGLAVCGWWCEAISWGLSISVFSSAFSRANAVVKLKMTQSMGLHRMPLQFIQSEFKTKTLFHTCSVATNLVTLLKNSIRLRCYLALLLLPTTEQFRIHSFSLR